MTDEVQREIQLRASRKIAESGGPDVLFRRLSEVLLKCIWKLYLAKPDKFEKAQEQVDSDVLSWFRRFVGGDFSDMDMLTYLSRHRLNELTPEQFAEIHSCSFADAIDKLTDDRVTDPAVITLRALWKQMRPRIARFSPALISSIKEISAEFIIWLKYHPDALEQIAWEAFEKLVAEIFSSKGFQVALTGRVRNQSADILAIRTDEFGVHTKYLIECKRYKSSNHIGFDIVNGVIGAARRADVDQAFLVTSSFFSGDVKGREQELRELRLHIRDGDAVRDWLRNYEVRKDYGIWLSDDWDHQDV